jgi:hypothetical protein
MITVKLYLNSIISTKHAHYCTINLKDFNLNTPMDHQLEYMLMKISNLPPVFVKSYNLNDLATNKGTIYVKIQKGMYGLLQVGILAQNLLKNQLNQHDYQQSIVTSGLWTGSLSCSLSVSTTLASSTLGKSTPTTLQKFLTNTTNVPLTGTENATLA